MVSADEELDWWEAIADGPDLAANLYDESIGTTEECLNEILPALDLWKPVGSVPDPSNAAILDLGCGTGRLLSGFAAALPTAHLVGVDISPRIIDYARAREDLRRVQLWVCDGRTLPTWAEGQFDAVYSMGLFQHLPVDACRGYVREVARVLRPGGRFRFQSVLGKEDAFLSHQTSRIAMAHWCSDAGLAVIAHEPSRLHLDWYWITAGKP